MSLSKIKITKTAQNLIGHFDSEAKVKVETIDDVWCLDIESEIAPLLIGRHGQTMQALEHLLRLMLAQEAGEFLSVNLDIAGYKALREQELMELAKKAAQDVIDSSKEETLPPMNSYERRLIHMALIEIEGIETSSVGEDPYRMIVIKKKIVE